MIGISSRPQSLSLTTTFRTDMEKTTEYRNCGVCEKRRQCWNTERYGEIGERGKRPFPRDAVCASFTCQKKEAT